MNKSRVKASSLTREVPSKLFVLREIGAYGTSGGAVKCVEIGRNAGGESGMLDLF